MSIAEAGQEFAQRNQRELDLYDQQIASETDPQVVEFLKAQRAYTAKAAEVVRQLTKKGA